MAQANKPKANERDLTLKLPKAGKPTIKFLGLLKQDVANLFADLLAQAGLPDLDALMVIAPNYGQFVVWLNKQLQTLDNIKKEDLDTIKSVGRLFFGGTMTAQGALEYSSSELVTESSSHKGSGARDPVPAPTDPDDEKAAPKAAKQQVHAQPKGLAMAAIKAANAARANLGDNYSDTDSASVETLVPISINTSSISSKDAVLLQTANPQVQPQAQQGLGAQGAQAPQGQQVQQHAANQPPQPQAQAQVYRYLYSINTSSVGTNDTVLLRHDVLQSAQNMNEPLVVEFSSFYWSPQVFVQVNQQNAQGGPNQGGAQAAPKGGAKKKGGSKMSRK